MVLAPQLQGQSMVITSSLDTYCAASSMFFLVAISFRPPR